MKLSLSWASGAALALALGACANTYEPAPAANARPELGPTAATTATAPSGMTGSEAGMDAGVRVTTLSVGEWPGVYEIDDEVTPLKVRIQNDSQRPLAVRHDRFTLTSDTGQRYRALPLWKIEGEGETSITVADPSPITTPGFTYSGFGVAPYYGTLYPGIGPYTGPSYYAGAGYGLYDTYFVDTELPTPEMRERALPEGVIDPGGYVEGYLFFEKVSDDAERVTFQYELTDPTSGQSFGALSIPYTVG